MSDNGMMDKKKVYLIARDFYKEYGQEPLETDLLRIYRAASTMREDGMLSDGDVRQIAEVRMKKQGICSGCSC